MGVDGRDRGLFWNVILALEIMDTIKPGNVDGPGALAAIPTGYNSRGKPCSRPRSVFKPRPGRHVSGLRTGRFGFESGSGQWQMALIIGF
jgi:hypothetical protein